MNGSNGIQWGCSYWGGGNGNGNGIVMEWVGYPFVTATVTATYLITLHFTNDVVAIAPNVNTCNDSVAVAVVQCERTFKLNYINIS